MAAYAFDLPYPIFAPGSVSAMVIPGTEGMAGYKNYAIHLRAFLRGLVPSLVSSAVLGVLVTLIPL